MTYYIDIEKATLNNNSYRKILFTSGNQQLVLMSISPGGDIPMEIHGGVDQFIRIESGNGILYSDREYHLHDGIAVTIPAGTKHQVVNTGNTPLKLYTIYSPPEHETPDTNTLNIMSLGDIFHSS
jgi:mannose-6-phosphate isomerase-like protein (cupin superfamily)